MTTNFLARPIAIILVAVAVAGALLAPATARIAGASDCPSGAGTGPITVYTPPGYPAQAATINVYPGITSTCVVRLPGGATLYANGDTAAPYNQPHPAGRPLQGRAIFRISGSGLDDPNGVNIVVTASSSDEPTAPELLPSLFADAWLTLPPGAELVYFEPATGRFIHVPNAHLRRAGLYKIIRQGTSPLPTPAPPATPDTLPATGGSPMGALLALAGALLLAGLGLGHSLLRALARRRRQPRRSTGRERAGIVLCAAGLLLGVATGASYTYLASAPGPQGFGTFADAAAGPLPHVAGAVGPPTRLVIPRLGLDTRVLSLGIANGAWQVPAYAAGYLAGGAWPGHAGNEAITGHDDRDGSVFRRLPELRRGDVVQVYAGTRIYRYGVVAMHSVPPTRVDVLRPTHTPMLTLITCTPYLVDTARLVVRAQLLP